MQEQAWWSEILSDFGIEAAGTQVKALTQGLINHTWKVITPGGSYILQRINTQVFKQPADLAHNIGAVTRHLQQYHPGYFFAAPLVCGSGAWLHNTPQQEYFRMFHFVENSCTHDTVQTPEEAYEAAKQFGKFTSVLSDFDTGNLRITIPGFHDLSLRYHQWLEAMQHGNKKRVSDAAPWLEELQSRVDLVNKFERIQHNPDFQLRVTHHDTKISNVLFDREGKGLCVIDLDTVMPGYFISDVGDMMRTYLSPVSEEERDCSRIEIRPAFYNAIVEGYLSEMGDLLSAVERDHFFYAGAFMIYMQALRFMTDHLNDDVYYGAAYPGHNLERAKNQITLLQRLEAAQEVLA